MQKDENEDQTVMAFKALQNHDCFGLKHIDVLCIQGKQRILESLVLAVGPNIKHARDERRASA